MRSAWWCGWRWIRPPATRPEHARRTCFAGRADLLRGIGAASVLIDDGALADQMVRLNLRVDGVFDLVGNSALRDSLRIARPGGRVCQLGFLGGLEPVAEFNPIADVPTGVQFSFYGNAVTANVCLFLRGRCGRGEAGPPTLSADDSGLV